MNLLLLYVLMFSPVQLIVLVSMHIPLIVQLPCFHGFLFLYLRFPHCCLSLCAFCPFFVVIICLFWCCSAFLSLFSSWNLVQSYLSSLNTCLLSSSVGVAYVLSFCGWVSWLQIVFSANSTVLSSLKVVSRQDSTFESSSCLLAATVLQSLLKVFWSFTLYQFYMLLLSKIEVFSSSSLPLLQS